MPAAYQPHTFTGEHLNHVAFPLGGLGAGMACLEGSGALSHVSLRHKPEVFNEPLIFSALAIKGTDTARVLEGSVPKRKIFGSAGTGNGAHGQNYGLPRFADCRFTARFPFAHVELHDPSMPVAIQLTGWSPFVPGDAEACSLPVFALEYVFTNQSDSPVDMVYSFHARNFMSTGRDTGARVRDTEHGFVLEQPPLPDKPAEEGYFAAVVDDPNARIDCAWFRGGWFDALTMLWNTVQACQAPVKPPHPDGKPGDGASIYLPIQLAPGEKKTVRLLACWFVPHSTLRIGDDDAKSATQCSCTSQCATEASTYVPWYAGRFPNIQQVSQYWCENYNRLREASQAFSDCFYDTTLPAEVVEAVAANLTILKSPTCLRQDDGRFWAWEGCCDCAGCCSGSCTHVWNYAQAMPHLLPELERSLRKTEFIEDQDDRGHQAFRASLPIRPVTTHDNHAAADGQLGGILKAYREWRVSGDGDWLRQLWPRIKQSLQYCIDTWDPDRTGTLVEPHHNTYDIEFWGADGMCTSIYLGALTAAVAMGRACGDQVDEYEKLVERGRSHMHSDLWNGQYFIQKVQWKGLRAGDPTTAKTMMGGDYSPEAEELLRRAGPKYQYGDGCLSDGVIGDWLARCCGVAPTLDPERVRQHLLAVFNHNFKADLSAHSNPQRPTYALGDESGLLLCSWPNGGKPALPFVYSDEVWSGIEYQVASHLIMLGEVEKGLTLVRSVRSRYDGRVRNPFNEYECGHWYARAMASYSLLQACSGVRYDAVDKVLYIQPVVPGDFRAFLSTATGFGTVGIKNGQAFIDVRHGRIEVKKISKGH